MILKSLVISWKMYFFLELCKNSVSEEISTLLVFISRVDHFVATRTKIRMKIALKKLFLQKQTICYFFSPKTCITTKVFQNTAKLMSISMQMISDKMHFDTIALRQKNAIWKVDGYNILSV